MAYQATVLRLMIGCPGDAEADMEILIECVNDWNAAHSHNHRIAILTGHWKTNVKPQLTGSPQDIVNKELLDDSDMLVALFHTRIGTMTETEVSGTVEEINRQILAKKPTMVYFSTAATNPSNIDIAQLQKLREFQTGLQNRGLYSTYSSTDDLRRKFNRDLAQHVNDLSTIVGSIVPLPKPPAVSEVAAELLLSATSTNGARIVYSRSAQGTSICTDERELNEMSDKRGYAKYDSAVKELEAQGLIEQHHNSTNIWNVTHAGFELTDLLRAHGNE